MKYEVKDGFIEIDKIFDLEETLDCGQAFRWKKDGEFWSGIALDKHLKLWQDDKKIRFYCAEEEFLSTWANYFDLFTDYEKIKEDMAKLDPKLKDITKFAPGIRILKQDSWEAICSFMLSQNNNIPRIKGIIELLCTNFGEKTDFGYLFPKYSVIAKCSEADLAVIKSGFRAKYLISAATLLESGKINIEEIRRMDINAARDALQLVKGIGPKVAECALLYGFYRTECFPMDVWMIRAMKELLPNLSAEDFGKTAGMAQQYIFHYSRHHL